MPRLTITLDEEQAELLEGKTGDGGGYDSKSEAVRDLIQRGEQAEQRIDELETERERLERKLTAVIENREEHTEIVRYVEEERTYRSAGLATRAKWWLFGMDGETAEP
jgi:Arc/MetJ-type ribon-helix-helix transcriptional regulator